MSKNGSLIIRSERRQQRICYYRLVQPTTTTVSDDAIQDDIATALYVVSPGTAIFTKYRLKHISHQAKHGNSDQSSMI